MAIRKQIDAEICLPWINSLAKNDSLNRWILIEFYKYYPIKSNNYFNCNNTDFQLRSLMYRKKIN